MSVLLKYAMKIDYQYHWTFQEISKIYGIIKGLCYLGRCQNSRLPARGSLSVTAAPGQQTSYLGQKSLGVI